LEQNTPNPRQGVSAALAAAQTRSAIVSSQPPSEDVAPSLAEMAQRDLDAALQLLADRAQYITGASGAAIALRREGRKDMLCRASAGSNAPELGALLSSEFGLSGESVRTRQLLRCDDAERDARVNREVCRQLGIASVVVMPVVHDDQVLGVLELFSGKANAFGERDVSAVQRLSEMVETAVRLARVMENLPERLSEREATVAEAVHSEVFEGQFLSDLVVEDPASAPATTTPAQSMPSETVKTVSPTSEAVVETKPVPQVTAESAPTKKPLFWSAALTPENDAAKPGDLDESHVPPVLRDLKKCVACGFPISAGRTLCVECEEKKWRGQLRQQIAARKPAAAASAVSTVKPPSATFAAAAPSMAKADAPLPAKNASETPGVKAAPVSQAAIAGTKILKEPTAPPAAIVNPPAATAPQTTAASSPDFVLSAGLATSQSWLARNKYMLLVLLVVGGAIAGFFLLR